MAFHQQKTWADNFQKNLPSHMISFIYIFAYSFVSSPLSILLCIGGQLGFGMWYFFPKNEKSIWLAIAHQWGGVDFWRLIVLSQVWKVWKSMNTLSVVLINAWVWCDSSMVSWIPPCSGLSQLCLILLCIFVHYFTSYSSLLPEFPHFPSLSQIDSLLQTMIVDFPIFLGQKLRLGEIQT